MAVPKKKHTRARSNRRRNAREKKLEKPNTSVCSNCKKQRIPHVACSNCGHYGD